MTAGLFISFAAILGWLVLACLLPNLRAHHRPRAQWALVASGVPMLGWLTLNWGPMAGSAGFALGLAALLWPPRRQRRGHDIASQD